MGEYNESKTYAELALAKSRETGSKETEKLCHRIICLCLAFGCSQHDRDTVCLKEMLSVIKESGDTESEATACYLLAMRHFEVGQMEEAAEFLEKSIQTSQKGCCKWLEMKSLIALGHTMLLPGQKNKAFQKLEEALQISEEIGDKRWKASALFDLGNAHYADGRYEEARKFYENSLQLIAKLPQIGIWVYIRLGTVLVELKQFDEAMKLLHKLLLLSM